MKKVLLVLAIVGMLVAPSFVYAETQQARMGNNNSTLPLPSPGVNYTIFCPPYNDTNGWGECWGANVATGYIGCAVNGSGESAALQQLKINVGRVKTLTIYATIKYIAGEKEGPLGEELAEISKIWRFFTSYFSPPYDYSVINPWLGWDEFITLALYIASAIGSLVGFGELVFLIASVGWSLLQFSEVVGEQNLSTTYINFSFTADPHTDNWIELGLQCKALNIGIGGSAAACGYIEQIKVYGIAPPAAPNICLLTNSSTLSTDTPYKFQVVTVDPNDDPVKYIIDWGDGTTTTVPTMGYEKSGKPINVTHSYSETGIYTIKVKAIDCDGMESEWNSMQIEISNHKPKIQSMCVYLYTIFGWEKIDRHKIPHWRNCQYQFFATDEDGNQLKFVINYGDGTRKESDLRNGIFIDYHRYISPGSYTITVNVTDGPSYNETKFDIYVTNSLPYTPSNPSPSNGETIYVSSNSQSTQESTNSNSQNQAIAQTTQTTSSTTSSTTSLETTQMTTISESSTTLDNSIDSSSIESSSNVETIENQQSVNSQNTINGMTLSWSGGDPDGDNVTYYIYFGADSASNLIGTVENICSYYYSGTLTAGTTYYWKVVAEDEFGATNESQTWHFTVKEDSDNNDANSLPDLYTIAFEMHATSQTTQQAETGEITLSSTEATSDTVVLANNSNTNT